MTENNNSGACRMEQNATADESYIMIDRMDTLLVERFGLERITEFREFLSGRYDPEENPADYLEDKTNPNYDVEVANFIANIERAQRVEQNKEMNIDDIEISKDLVVCYIIEDSGDGFIQGTPMVTNSEEGWLSTQETSSEGIIETERIEGRIINIVPAQPGTYQVTGCYGEHGSFKPLGYEMPGAYHPDWRREFIDRYGDEI